MRNVYSTFVKLHTAVTIGSGAACFLRPRGDRGLSSRSRGAYGTIVTPAGCAKYTWLPRDARNDPMAKSNWARHRIGDDRDEYQY